MVGRARFGKWICPKDRDHKWSGELPEDVPRHIVAVSAMDFQEAKMTIKKQAGKEAPRPRGWWCKAAPPKS